jgi:hypothetical protein
MTDGDHRFEVIRAIRKSNLKVLAGMLVLSGMAGIAVQPLKAQNQNVLDRVLAQFAESGRIQAGAKLPVQQGFANGGLAIYITPEVGVDPNSSFVSTAQGIAQGFHANFIPANWVTLPGSPAVRRIFVFTNVTQGNVLGSLPTPAGPNSTNAGYSPLWQVSLVAWNNPANATVLTSAAAVTAAETAGEVTVTSTPIVVECSVVLGIAPTGQLPGSKVDLSAATFAAGGSVTSTANLPLQAGYFNHEPALYITPEVGLGPGGSAFAATAQSIAQGFNANFVPTAFNTLNDQNPAVDDIYVFSNFTQGNVLASAPSPAGVQNTDPNYTPIWQINLVAWNSGHRPRPLTSQQDILNAQKNNEVTVTLAPIIVECSVIFTPRGGLLPGAEITVNNAVNNDRDDRDFPR